MNYDEIEDMLQDLEHVDVVRWIESLQKENTMLRDGDTCARICEGTAYRIEARQLRRELERRNLSLSTCEEDRFEQGREIEQLKALLKEARDDIAESIEATTPSQNLRYPIEHRRYRRDMSIVHRIDAELTERNKT